MAEYIDIVTEDNEPTGEKRLRTEVHAQGLWHRSVHIYLFRAKTGQIEILVHLRSKNKDLCPNKWDTRFGGHVKAGETIAEAVGGELHEEIGLRVEPDKLIQGETYKHDGGTNREFNPVYYYRFDGSTDSLKFNDGEVQKIRWMTEDEIKYAFHTEPENWGASLSGFEQVMKVLIAKLGKAKN
jgi:isopentenyldiphosphate isomerase